jgi:hypothetical protein
MEKEERNWSLWLQEGDRKTRLLAGTLKACTYLARHWARDRGILVEVGGVGLNPAIVTEDAMMAVAERLPTPMRTQAGPITSFVIHEDGQFPPPPASTGAKGPVATDRRKARG